MTHTTHQSFCRLCHNACPIVVDVEDGRATKVVGDESSPIHKGYVCVKGRAIPELENSPTRLLHSMKRDGDTFSPIASSDAVAEIAGRLRQILDTHGPRSVAIYVGTSIAGKSPAAFRMTEAFMDAIGSPMRFTANTIDQPGKMIAKGFHGFWMAPLPTEPDVLVLLGRNPLVSHAGATLGDPGDYFKRFRARGATLIVVDPRRSQVAARADIHLQIHPGEDVAVLAGMVHVILEEGLHDAAFVADNVDGVDRLRAAVAPYTPSYVAQRAGIDAEDLVRTARLFAGAKHASARAGTGPNMGTGHGTLCEYLVLALHALCGSYLREGDKVPNPGTLFPKHQQKAQAFGPFPAYDFGERLRVRGFADTAAGLQTAALPEEILLPGEGQVRALFVVTGNPVAAFPDQLLTIKAMKSLDLLVSLDVEMSQTAKLAHYVIAPTMSLEVPGLTLPQDWLLAYSNGAGAYPVPAAQYTAPVTSRPEGSDLLQEWEFFYDLAAKLDLQLEMRPGFPLMDDVPDPVALDMEHKPTSDDLFELMAMNSRIPLAEVKKHPGVAVFPSDAVVGPKDPGWEGRLHVDEPEMLRDLEAIASSGDVTEPMAEGFDFRLLCRRVMQFYNSATNVPSTNRGRPHNLTYLHPDDMAELGLADYDVATITSVRASIPAVVAGDKGLRRGMVSMVHNFGGAPSEDDDVLAIGSPAGRLLPVDVVYDRYSGQPLMSNIPVKVTRAPASVAPTGP
jgi:anaerobic selenocysteine-containing dehydrogenase